MLNNEENLGNNCFEITKAFFSLSSLKISEHKFLNSSFVSSLNIVKSIGSNSFVTSLNFNISSSIFFNIIINTNIFF